MKSFYIKAQRRAKFEQFAKKFFYCAAAFGLVVLIACTAFELGRGRGYSAGLSAGVQELNDCENAGGTGFYIDAAGAFRCIYE